MLTGQDWSTVLKRRCCGYWKFYGGAASPVADSTGRVNAATVTGGSWTTVGGRACLSMNGSSDRIALASAPVILPGPFYAIKPFTISAWVYVTNDVVMNMVYGACDGTNIFLMFCVNHWEGGAGTFGVRHWMSPSQGTTYASGLTKDAWHQIVYVQPVEYVSYSGQTLCGAAELWLDGVKKSTTVGGGTLAYQTVFDSYYSRPHLGVFRYSDNLYYYPFGGGLGDISFYAGALPPGAIGYLNSLGATGLY